jgi:uncharacterized surface protein with fasciclin (FAS1) repeats
MKTTIRTAGLFAAAAAALTLAACNNNDAQAPATPAEPTPEAAPVDPAAPTANAETGDIVAAASTSPEFTTLTSAIQAADLQGRLSGPGPFTVFAPTNAAFEKIPAATRTSLLQPAQKAELSKILTYHVVPGRLTAADLKAQATANNGVATLSTVQGEKLTARDAGNGQWELTDAKGNKAKITLADQTRSNGVVHVIDTVLMP